MSIDELFKSIPDFRRGQGQRYELSSALWMIFLGIASGYSGYREIATFSLANSSYFISYFGLKHGVPSHVTFWQILTHLNKDEVIAKFNEWAKSQDLKAYDWLSGDGKSLKSTVTNSQNSQQNFSAVVSLFCQKSGLSYLIADYQNKKIAEAEVLRSLLPSLKDKGIVLTLDAIHTQKNAKNDC
jgi:DDE_Tnp_1-associated